jgi:TPR repeat protein
MVSTDGARMKIPGPLLAAPVIALFSLSLFAQEHVPDSYLQELATIDRLRYLTPTELADLTSRAQSGGAEAQYQLALVYGAGRIVPRDEVTWQRWMMKSAEQGYVPAETMIGCSYLNNDTSAAVPNYAEGEKWLLSAAMQGDAEAQFWLGLGYDQGYLGRTDYEESLRWLRKSAAQGLPDAQYALGWMYEDGHGVPKSDEHAAYWFRRAADHYSDISGVFQAKTELASLYRDGRLKENKVEAYKWFAIVEAALYPPTDEDVKAVSESMTQAQIAEAQHEVDEWIAYHPPRPK